jgi:predicted PurR-regulated permease PerM
MFRILMQVYKILPWQKKLSYGLFFILSVYLLFWFASFIFSFFIIIFLGSFAYNLITSFVSKVNVRRVKPYAKNEDGMIEINPKGKK